MVNIHKIIASIGLYFTPILPLIKGSQRAQQAKEEKTTEVMNMKNVASMPMIASITLFGLYLFIKFISPDYLQYLLTFYFMIMGAYGISDCFNFIFAKFASAEKFDITIPIIKKSFQTSKAQIVGVAVGMIICTLWCITRHWMLNNFIAYSLTIVSMAEIITPSYLIAGLLLVALFFYDIFWVFGSDVMVTVATKVDGPIKFLFPKDGNILFGKECSLLGLGDIALPGLFIALMMRLDKKLNNGSKYFVVSLVSYHVGLLMTFVVMHVFQHGQPALLYLVPALLIGTMGYALIRGEFKMLVTFNESEDDEEEEDDSSESESDDDEKEEGDDAEEKKEK